MASQNQSKKKAATKKAASKKTSARRQAPNLPPVDNEGNEPADAHPSNTANAGAMLPPGVRIPQPNEVLMWEGGQLVAVNVDVFRQSVRSADAVNDHDDGNAKTVTTALQLRHFEWLTTAAAREGVTIPHYLEKMVRREWQNDPHRHAGGSLSNSQMEAARAAMETE